MKKNKLKKPLFYIKNILQSLIPRLYLTSQKTRLFKRFQNLSESEKAEILQRTNYYNQLTEPFELDEEAKSYREYHLKRHSFYYYDLKQYLRYFPADYRFSYLFGDITHIPEVPTLLKSRPIGGENQNSVLMKLDQLRHFRFINDPFSFVQKRNAAVFRGICTQPHRQRFLETHRQTKNCNLGDTGKHALGTPYHRPFMSLLEQLHYKFIISLEGNDVATNLKWILSSNSLCFMPKPKYETWFMEGTLIPDYHYVQLRDDYANLEEKMNYYSRHTEKALEILRNAQTYVARFRHPYREKLISIMVLEKYFRYARENHLSEWLMEKKGSAVISD